MTREEIFERFDDLYRRLEEVSTIPGEGTLVTEKKCLNGLRATVAGYLNNIDVELARESLMTFCEALRLFTYEQDGSASYWMNMDDIEVKDGILYARMIVPLKKVEDWNLANAGVGIRTIMSVRDWKKVSGRKRTVMTNEDVAQQAPKTMDELKARQKRPCKNCGGSPKPVDWKGGE